MAVKRRLPAGAQSSSGDATPTTTVPAIDGRNNPKTDIWSAENELKLLQVLMTHKPFGISKHFQMVLVLNKLSQGNTTDGLKYETAGGIEEDKSVEIGAGESKTKYENEFIPEIDNIHEPEQESPENTTQLLTTQLTPDEATEGSVQVRAGEADGKYGSISITEEQQSLENTTQHLTVQLAQTENLDESGLLEEVIGNDTYNKIENTNNTEQKIIKVTSTLNLY